MLEMIKTLMYDKRVTVRTGRRSDGSYTLVSYSYDVSLGKAARPVAHVSQVRKANSTMARLGKGQWSWELDGPDGTKHWVRTLGAAKLVHAGYVAAVWRANENRAAQQEAMVALAASQEVDSAFDLTGLA